MIEAADAIARELLARSPHVAVGFALVWLAERALARRAGVRARAASWHAFALALACPALAVTSPAMPAASMRVDARGWDAAGATIGLVWLAGALVFASAALVRSRATRRAWLEDVVEAPRLVRDEARRLATALGSSRAPRVVVGSGERGPAALGVFAPIIVLPRAIARAPRARREHVLAHEVAHVARRDGLASAVWLALTCAWWFHPCVWLASARAATLRELGADAAAARAVGDAARYRSTLLAAARERHFATAPPAMAFVPRRAEILERLDALERVARGSRARELATFALVFACCAPLVERTTLAPDGLAALEGCLRQRYAVLAELARANQLPGAADVAGCAADRAP